LCIIVSIVKEMKEEREIKIRLRGTDYSLNFKGKGIWALIVFNRIVQNLALLEHPPVRKALIQYVQKKMAK